MKKHLLFAAFFLAVSLGFAQVPGYQGKKFAVKYDLGVMHPTILGRTGKLPMLYHNVTFDYTIARAWTLGVKYGFMTYKAAPARGVFANGYGYYDDYVDPNDFKGRYTQHTVSFLARHFYKRKGFIAPVGRYITIGAFYQYAVDNMTTFGQTYDPVTGNQTYSVTGYKAISHFPGVTFGVGRNFIVANRMIIDIGFNLNIAPPPFTIIVDDELKAGAYANLFMRNLLQIYVGLGALAF